MTVKITVTFQTVIRATSLTNWVLHGT